MNKIITSIQIELYRAMEKNIPLFQMTGIVERRKESRSDRCLHSVRIDA